MAFAGASQIGRDHLHEDLPYRLSKWRCWSAPSPGQHTEAMAGSALLDAGRLRSLNAHGHHPPCASEQRTLRPQQSALVDLLHGCCPTTRWSHRRGPARPLSALKTMMSPPQAYPLFQMAHPACSKRLWFTRWRLFSCLDAKQICLNSSRLCQ